jgi:hypothetical protein
MDLLAKEFASVPDREIPPSETHEDDQSSAMSGEFVGGRPCQHPFSFPLETSLAE